MNRYFIFLIVIFLGCAASKNTVQQDPPQDKNSSGIVEDLDPASLGELEYVVEPRLERQQKKPGVEQYLTPGQTEGDTSGVEEIIKVPGFRVQIGSLSNQVDAGEIQREAMLQFEDANVYLEFEIPYYKIRVGDFEVRNDAEELQKKAVGLGYSDAWIVRTIIEKKGKTP